MTLDHVKLTTTRSCFVKKREKGREDGRERERAREREGGREVTKRMRMVIEYTRCHVKTKSKLINLKINSRIEGYNGK